MAQLIIKFAYALAGTIKYGYSFMGLFFLKGHYHVQTIILRQASYLYNNKHLFAFNTSINYYYCYNNLNRDQPNVFFCGKGCIYEYHSLIGTKPHVTEMAKENRIVKFL